MKIPVCGDNVVDNGEACDDGDTIDNGVGSCNATCTAKVPGVC